MENTVKNRKQPRKSGLELLRIVAVVLIVAHHLVCHSGYPLFDEPLSVLYAVWQSWHYFVLVDLLVVPC